MVDSYDVKAGNESAFATTDTITLKEVQRFASTGDLVFKWLGFFSGIIFGAGMPAMCLIFGSLIDSVTDSKSDDGFEKMRT